jgi:hypothetical protein
MSAILPADGRYWIDVALAGQGAMVTRRVAENSPAVAPRPSV